MSDVMTVAEKLHTSPTLFPWVCLAVVLIILLANRKTIQEYISACVVSKKQSALYQAQNNELIRNNTAALNNNTAMLEMVKQDRELMIQKLEHHEEMSKERVDNIRVEMTHIETVMNQTRDGVLNNGQELAIVSTKVEK